MLLRKMRNPGPCIGPGRAMVARVRARVNACRARAIHRAR